MVKFLKKAGLCGIILALFACGDSDLLKFDNLEGVKNWEPDFKLQLAYANYDVWRLIEQADNGDSTIIEKDNQIFIRHFQENVAHLEVSEVMTLPEDIAHFTLEAPIPDTLVGQPLPEDLIIPIPEDSVLINFKEGRLTRIDGNINCRYELFQSQFDYEVTIEFTNVFFNEAPLRFIFPSSDEENGKSKDVLFDMASSPNQVKWKANIRIPKGQIVNLDKLNIKVELKDFSFTRVEGTMKPQFVKIKEGEFDMDVEFWDNFDGSFNFTNPKVDLIVRNYGLGVPVQMDMNFVAYGENGKSVSLESWGDGKPLIFKGWNPGSNKDTVETQGYNVGNSNIAELLSLPPKEKITYGGKIIVSPDSTQAVTVLSTGNASVDAYVEIPLQLSVKDLIFRDTIDDIDIGDADKIKEAEIIVRADNRIPLGLGSGYLLLLDETKRCIDSVKVDRFLDAPEVNDRGELIEIEETNNEKESSIILTKKNISNLDKTKYIVILVNATTSKEGEIPVVIKADAELKLQLLLKAKLNLEDVF
ncbi:MAG: hypothetical protein NC410_05970 [Oscillibacter sp.]|nr:hypothetical protein [Oscillibacter sp.]